MNLCTFIISSFNSNIDISFRFKKFNNAIIKIGRDDWNKIVNNVYSHHIRVTKNTVICKIYGEWELLIFEIPDNVSVSIARADKCIFSKVYKCSNYVKFNKIEFQKTFKIIEKD